jgi:hypothetical protein
MGAWLVVFLVLAGVGVAIELIDRAAVRRHARRHLHDVVTYDQASQVRLVDPPVVAYDWTNEEPDK